MKNFLLLVTVLSTFNTHAFDIDDINISGNDLSWESTGGWMQVQDTDTYATLAGCSGFINFCATPEEGGTYQIIDHSNNDKVGNIVIGEGDLVAFSFPTQGWSQLQLTTYPWTTICQTSGIEAIKPPCQIRPGTYKLIDHSIGTVDRNFIVSVDTAEDDNNSIDDDSPKGEWISVGTDEWVSGNSLADASSSHRADWSGNNNFLPDNGSTDAWRVSIAQGANHGASRIWENFPLNTKHVKLKYRVFFPADYANQWKDQDSNMKMPGITGPVSAQNGGFGGSQNSTLPHSERAWSARQLVQRPTNSFGALSAGMELYTKDSTNPGGSNFIQYGDAEWYSANGSIRNALTFTAGTWDEVEVEVRVNDHNQANGFIKTSLNGKEGFTKSNMEYSKNQEMLSVNRIWMNVYHGGAKKSSPGTLWIFLRDFQYQIID